MFSSVKWGRLIAITPKAVVLNEAVYGNFYALSRSLQNVEFLSPPQFLQPQRQHTESESCRTSSVNWNKLPTLSEPLSSAEPESQRASTILGDMEASEAPDRESPEVDGATIDAFLRTGAQRAQASTNCPPPRGRPLPFPLPQVSPSCTRGLPWASLLPRPPPGRGDFPSAPA